MITISEARTSRELKQFIKFPWSIYRHDKYWVPPIISDQQHFFNPQKNPYYQHSKVKLLLAWQEGRLVGRLSVHENILHVQRHHEHIGFFGFFESVDNAAVAKALFDYGTNWLRGLGYQKVRGPANFSINGEYSLLVKGFDSSPMAMMTYNPPYYEKLLTQYGFTTSQEMYAFLSDIRKGLPAEVLQRATQVENTHPEFIVRNMDKHKLEQEARIVFDIYRQAWDENWGAVPPTEAEIMALAKELQLIIDEDIAYIGEIGGQPIGFSLSIPDANQVLKIANGRLWPFGALKMLWKKRSINAIRVLAMGVLKEHRHQGFDTVFYKKTYDEALKKGYLNAEASLINESNLPMRHVLERLGAQVYKTYRMYDLDVTTRV